MLEMLMKCWISGVLTLVCILIAAYISRMGNSFIKTAMYLDFFIFVTGLFLIWYEAAPVT